MNFNWTSEDGVYQTTLFIPDSVLRVIKTGDFTMPKELKNATGNVTAFAPDDFGTLVYWFARLQNIDIWRYDDQGRCIIFICFCYDPNRGSCFNVKVWKKDLWIGQALRYEVIHGKKMLVEVCASPTLHLVEWHSRGSAAQPGSIFQALGL